MERYSTVVCIICKKPLVLSGGYVESRHGYMHAAGCFARFRNGEGPAVNKGWPEAKRADAPREVPE